MARSSFFARANLILPFLALQLFVSATEARFRTCNNNDFDDFNDCEDDNLSSAEVARRRKIRIIAGAVVGGIALLIALSYFIFVCCKRRKARAKQVPAYAFTNMQGGYANAPAAGYPYPPPQGGPPPSQGDVYANAPQGGYSANPPKGGAYASPLAPPPPGHPAAQYGPGYGNGYGQDRAIQAGLQALEVGFVRII
ncbi:hypothetical protein C8R46DRAFT_1217038 [Mycena filopes]|nr:hypothetical protein C8R46DRAFT_1217038 [Mycena filopes]